LVEEGLLALDDPVQRYLPPGVELPVRGRPITLSDLATHTAGLPRLPHGFFLRSVRHRRNPYAWFTVEGLCAGLSATRLRREPGGRPRYSNLGYGLLGHLLVLRARRGYERLVQERICRPLTHALRARHRRVAVGLGWTRPPLPGTEHELLFHNGGTGGFRSFAGFVPATHTAVVVLSNCARSVDALGFRILQRIEWP